MSYIGNGLAQGLISGANIQDGTVDTPDLKTSAVTNSKLADNSVTPGKMDFSAGSANGVVYLNGSKVPSVGTTLTWDGTTLSTSAFSASSTVTLSGGTANGVAYLNGSKVVTSGSALTFDGSNLGTSTSGSTGLTMTSSASQAFINLRSVATAGFEPFIGFGDVSAGNIAQMLGVNGGGVRWTVAGSEQMRLTSTGLGIGTSSPSFKLDIAGSSPRIRVADASTGYAINQYSNTSGSLFVGVDDSTGGAFSQGGYTRNIYSTGAYPIVFSTNSTGRMTLDSSGNLGLGVTPSAWSGVRAFEVAGGPSIMAFSTNAYYGANYYYNGGAYVYKANGRAYNYVQDANGHQWFTAPSGTAGNAITWTQAMTLNASGSLGIGTSAPSAKLHVYKSNQNQLQLQCDDTGQVNINMGGTTTPAKGAIYFSDNNGSMWFNTASTQRMTLDSSGNLGIGTSSPISGSGITVADATYPAITIASLQSNSSWTQNQEYGKLAFYSSDTSGLGAGETAKISVIADTSSTTYPAGALAFFTSNRGVSTTITERMRLDSSGNLGLGVTPSAWWSYMRGFDIGLSSALFARTNDTQVFLTNNSYYNGTNYIYKANSPASLYRQQDNYHAWFTAPSGTAGNAISFTQAMTLDASGRLGVGATSPAEMLDVSKTGDIKAQIVSTNGDNSALRLSSAGNRVWLLQNIAGPLRFYDETAGAERARIDSSGNFLFGATANSSTGMAGQTPKIYVNGYSNIGGLRVNGADSGNTIYSDLGTDMSITVAGANALLFKTSSAERARIDSSGNLLVGTTSSLWGAANRGVVEVNGGSTAIYGLKVGGTAAGYIYHSGSDMSVWNTYNNALQFGTNNSERARITSDGDLLVGWTGGTYNDPGYNNVNGLSLRGGASNPASIIVSSQNSSGVFNYYSYKLGSATTGYHITFSHNASGVGSITTSASATAYNTSSDYRLKHDIQPMTGALAKVVALKPVTYKWNVDNSDGEGFIAHELAEVVPGCVTGEKDAVDEDGNPVYQGIDTSFLVATLAAAIQELKADLDATKAELAALKGT